MKHTTLEAERRRRRLSVRELSAMTKGRVSPATISRIERRTTRPLAEHIQALERALGVSLVVQSKATVDSQPQEVA